MGSVPGRGQVQNHLNPRFEGVVSKTEHQEPSTDHFRSICDDLEAVGTHSDLNFTKKIVSTNKKNSKNRFFDVFKFSGFIDNFEKNPVFLLFFDMFFVKIQLRMSSKRSEMIANRSELTCRWSQICGF